MDMNVQQNEAQTVAILNMLHICAKRHPEASFYEILKNLGLIENTNADFTEANYVTIQKLLHGDKLNYAYGADPIYKDEKAARETMEKNKKEEYGSGR